MTVNDVIADVRQYLLKQGMDCEFLEDRYDEKNLTAVAPRSLSGERAVRFWLFYDVHGEKASQLLVNINAVVAREIPRDKFTELRILLNKLNKDMQYAKLILDEEENFVFACSHHLLPVIKEVAEDSYTYLAGTLEDIRRVSDRITEAAGLPAEKDAINPTVPEKLPEPAEKYMDVVFYDWDRNIRDVLPLWEKTLCRKNVTQCAVSDSQWDRKIGIPENDKAPVDIKEILSRQRFYFQGDSIYYPEMRYWQKKARKLFPDEEFWLVSMAAEDMELQMPEEKVRANMKYRKEHPEEFETEKMDRESAEKDWTPEGYYEWEAMKDKVRKDFSDLLEHYVPMVASMRRNGRTEKEIQAFVDVADF